MSTFGQEDSLVSSALAWVEISRALTALLHGNRPNLEITEAIAVTLSGVAERRITGDVIGLARRISPPRLRTLDAIHLASAILLDVDAIFSYDDRLTEACRLSGLATLSPGRRPHPPRFEPAANVTIGRVRSGRDWRSGGAP